MIKCSDKLDWFEFSCFYTKNPALCADTFGLMSDYQIHKHHFGDQVIEALFDPNCVNRQDRIDSFCNWILPDEWSKLFDEFVVSLEPYSFKGYSAVFRIGDSDRFFLLAVPLKEIDGDGDVYCIENPKKGCLQCFNTFLGYRVIFSGSNIPFDVVKLRACPDCSVRQLRQTVRFNVSSWACKLQAYNTLLKITRCDVALDLGIHFSEFVAFWRFFPLSLKCNYMRENKRLVYNDFDFSGEISCGVRGKGNDSYLRIYNKAAEQKGKCDNYPWGSSDFLSDVEPLTNIYNKEIYEVPWTRIEYELRGTVAWHFLSDYFDSVLTDDSIAHFVFDNFGIYDCESDKDKQYAIDGYYVHLKRSDLWNDVVESYNLIQKLSNEYFVPFGEELIDRSYNVSVASMRFALRSTPFRTGIRLLHSVNRSIDLFASYTQKPEDKLKYIADLIAHSDDIVETLSLIPLDFAESVANKQLSDILRFCHISKARAVDMLNEAGMKGYFDAVKQKLFNVAQASDDESSSDDCIIESDFKEIRKNEK